MSTLILLGNMKNSKAFSSRFDTRIKKKHMEPGLCILAGGGVSCLVKVRAPLMKIIDLTSDVNGMFCCV